MYVHTTEKNESFRFEYIAQLRIQIASCVDLQTKLNEGN